jgi:hypothetical protein
MAATFDHKFCLSFQQYYTFLGEPCSSCPQGQDIRSGLFDDSDIKEIWKEYENNENIFVNY